MGLSPTWSTSVWMEPIWLPLWSSPSLLENRYRTWTAMWSDKSPAVIHLCMILPTPLARASPRMAERSATPIGLEHRSSPVTKWSRSGAWALLFGKFLLYYPSQWARHLIADLAFCLPSLLYAVRASGAKPEPALPRISKARHAKPSTAKHHFETVCIAIYLFGMGSHLSITGISYFLKRRGEWARSWWPSYFLFPAFLFLFLSNCFIVCLSQRYNSNRVFCITS